MTSLVPGAPAYLDAAPGDDIPRLSPMAEMGQSGLRRNSGYVDDEFLPQLRGRKAVKIYREMSDNNPSIGAWYAAVSQLLRQIEWDVEPGGRSKEATEDKKFLEECQEDMTHSWGDMITEIAAFGIYGWQLNEMNFKRRMGPDYTNRANNDQHRSKYTDGKIGWHSITGRAQETMVRWVFGDHGEILGMVQQAPPRYQRVVIPMTKCLLFRTNKSRNNPEGRSLLRNCYEPWYYLKRHQEIEAIGVSRDLAGVPIAKVPNKILSAKPGTLDGDLLASIKKMITSVHRNEQEGIIWPNDTDPDTKLPYYDFSLINSGGSRQFDTEGIINRYKTEILQALLADFIQVGHESNGGSYALHTDKTGLFRTCINALAQMIAEEFNRVAIPLLFRLNGRKVDVLPKLVPQNVDPPDLTQLTSFMSTMAQLGVRWFPDPVLENFLRDAAELPALDDRTEKQLEQERRQAQIVALAQQKMQALQVEQQAQQGALANEQQDMANQQQAQELAAGPAQGQAADPNDAVRSGIGVQTDKVKLAQEKQKLANLKKPAPKAASGRPTPSRPAGKKTAVRKYYVREGVR